MTPGTNPGHRILGTSHTSQRLVLLILFLFTIAFLYEFRPIEMSDNSLNYVAAIEQIPAFDLRFYPPHLLHIPAITLLHSLLSSISSCDVVCAGMTHSVIWAAIAIVSVYLIAQVLFRSVVGSIVTALAVLVAHGFWVYATQLEVYVPVVGCTTAVTALLFTNQSDSLSWARVVAVSALWALATMYHTANILFFVPFAVFFYGTQGWRGWRQLATVSVLAGSVVFATYVGAYLWVRNEVWSIEDFLLWVLEITNRPLTYYGSLSNLGAKGLLRAVFEQIETITVLPSYLTLDQRYPFSQMPLAVVGALILGMALLWNCIKIARRGPSQLARIYFILWFTANLLFFAWWEPTTHKFYIPSSIPLIMLVAMAIRDIFAGIRSERARQWLGGAAAMVVAVVFLFNLPSVLELRRSFGPFYADAAVLNRLAPENCTIYAVGAQTAALSVYFDRRDNAYMPRLEQDFYRLKKGEVGAEEARFKDEECALIAVGWLSKQRYKRHNRDLDSASWPEYVAYVLDAHTSSPSDSIITYNPFEIVAEGDGPPHLLVDRRRRAEVGSIDQLAEMIDVEVDHALRASEPACRTDDYVWILLTVPRTRFEIGRDRDLIFGYSWHSGQGDFARRVCRPADGPAR